MQAIGHSRVQIKTQGPNSVCVASSVADRQTLSPNKQASNSRHLPAGAAEGVVLLHSGGAIGLHRCLGDVAVAVRAARPWERRLAELESRPAWPSARQTGVLDGGIGDGGRAANRGQNMGSTG